MRKIFIIIILLSITLFGCNLSTNTNEAYYTKEYINIAAGPVILEEDFEDVTQEEMMTIYQNWIGNPFLDKILLNTDFE